jgi:hypothetical protein
VPELSCDELVRRAGAYCSNRVEVPSVVHAMVR